MKFTVRGDNLVVVPESPEESYWITRRFKIHPRQARKIACSYFVDGERVEDSFLLALMPYTTPDEDGLNLVDGIFSGKGAEGKDVMDFLGKMREQRMSNFMDVFTQTIQDNKKEKTDEDPPGDGEQ